MSDRKPLLCAQCGAPLAGDAGESGCLNCLLGGGVDEMITPEGQTARRRFQHYEIELQSDGTPIVLGQGAMGVTYLAIDRTLQLPVALKVISQRYAGEPAARRQLLEEARAAASLRHPNVASVFHFGTEPAGEEGECFFAMELVEGETLEEVVRETGPLPVPAALELARQVARALVAAEERGLVHRDLKPSNLMLTRRPAAAAEAGEAWIKVIDFGLAVRKSEVRKPKSDSAGGTPNFASPEQLDGRALDGRADIYSLGLTLWYALTGRVPWVANSVADIRRQQEALPLAQLRSEHVPEPVVALLGSLSAFAPEERPQSARELLERIDECVRQLQPDPPRGWPVLAGLGVLAVLGIGAVVLAGLGRSRPEPAPPPILTAAKEPSGLAVLPFESFSRDPADAYFAEGMQDDLVTTLARIRQLKVISRSSVLQFPPGAPRDLAAIGRELAVAHVLEGSVRRTGDRALVNVALTECRTGAQVWVERYDRTLPDVLSLQGELATAIAKALHASLQADERARVEGRPTENPAAYLLYLRAREYETRPLFLSEDFLTAETLYAEAVALDPKFALARARLAATRAYIYRNLKPNALLQAQAHEEALEAIRLRPDLGETHLARALCLYRMDRDFEGALRELDQAAQRLPSSAEIEMTRAFIQRRQGRFRESLAGTERALALDPLNAQIVQETLSTHRITRNWSAAAVSGARAVQLAPTLAVLRVENARVALWARGDLGPLNEALAAVPAGVDPDGLLTYLRWDAAMLARDFPAARRAAETSTHAVTLPAPGGVPLPKSYLLGVAALAAGDTETALAHLEAARPALEAEVANHPEHGYRRCRLGLLYAYLGWKEAALREGRRAVEMIPESKDAFGGPYFASFLALIQARCDEPEAALDWLEYLLRTPGAVYLMEPSVTLAELRLRWQWDPLRNHPRFQKLLAEGEPPTRW